jgi:hypothetical protein
MDINTLKELVRKRYITLCDYIGSLTLPCKSDTITMYNSYCSALLDVYKIDWVVATTELESIQRYIKIYEYELNKIIDDATHKHNYLSAVENLSHMTKTYPKILDLVTVAEYDDIIKLDEYTFKYNHPDYDYQNIVLYKELCEKYGV